MTTSARRTFLLSAGAAAGSLALGACARAGETKPPQVTSALAAAGGEKEVTPAEDLMREHGAIERILLVYDESARRLQGDAPWPIDALAAAAGLVRSFVEDYHERLEEEFVFPRVAKAGKDADLVAILRRQHQVGRTITDTVRRLAVPATLTSPAAKQELADRLRAFTRMYRPHAAREDTVLFVDFSRALPEQELHDLGERFEAREVQLFGEGGFERVVGRIAEIETALGVHDLASFTAS